MGIRKLLPKSEFSKNVLTLMTGTTIAQAIPVAISPILTRLYTPEDFGVFALYTSVASIVSLIATGRYELAIMLPKKNEDAANVVILSLIITFITSILILIVVYFFNSAIAKLLRNNDIASWLYLVPLTVLFSGIYQSLNYWVNRKKQYSILAKSRVIRSSGIAATNISLGVTQAGCGGLILGSTVGQAVGSIALLKNSMDILKYKIYFAKMFACAKRFKKMPIFNLPNALIDGIRMSGINILISFFFSSVLLGQFSLAWRVIQSPASLIGSSVAQVIFERFSKAKKDDLTRLIFKYLSRSTVFSFPIFLSIYLFSPTVFSFVFGTNWKIAGDVTSALSPWLFLNFITSPLSTIFIVINRQEVMLIFSIIYMATPILLLFLLHDMGFITVMRIISFSMSIILVLFIISILFYSRTLKQKDKKCILHLP